MAGGSRPSCQIRSFCFDRVVEPGACSVTRGFAGDASAQACSLGTLMFLLDSVRF